MLLLKIIRLPIKGNKYNGVQGVLKTAAALYSGNANRVHVSQRVIHPNLSHSITGQIINLFFDHKFPIWVNMNQFT